MSEEKDFNDARLVDPYAKVDRTTTSIAVANSVRAYLLSLNPNQSVVQITMNVLLDKLVKKLKAQGFTSYDPGRYCETVKLADVVLPGETQEPDPVVKDHVKRPKIKEVMT